MYMYIWYVHTYTWGVLACKISPNRNRNCNHNRSIAAGVTNAWCDYNIHIRHWKKNDVMWIIFNVIVNKIMQLIVCVCVCTYMCVAYIYVYICTHTHTHTHICIYFSVIINMICSWLDVIWYEDLCKGTCICVCECVCICMCICIHILQQLVEFEEK